MDGVYSCGIDIEEIARFDAFIKQSDSSLLRDIWTECEVKNLCGDEKVRLALSFSCKEAFFKAFGVSWTNSVISWKDIELLFNGPGFDSYKVHLHGYAKELLLRNKVGIGEISFDVNDEYVMFEVVLLKQDEG